jgi:hypothetical protein
VDTLRDWFLNILYFIICPLVFISYLFEQLTSDVLIYLGTAKVAAITGGFPMNLDTVWELKYVGHRLLYYILNILSPFEDPVYSIWIKLLVAIPTLLILYYFSKRISERMELPFHYPFIIGFFGLFTVNRFVILSSESISISIGMLFVILLLDEREWIWFLSGLLILPLITMKGLPVLIVPIVALLIMMLVRDYKPRFYTALCSVPIVISSLIIISGYFPHFISDIFLSTKLARISYLHPLINIEYFFKYGLGVIGFIPVVVIGGFVLFLVLSIANREHFRTIKLLLLMWGISAVYVLIISEFFYYHYYLMLVPAILTICYFLKFYKHHKYAFAILVVAVLIIFCGVVSEWSVGLEGRGYVYQSARQASVTAILSKYDILNQSTTLYLDAGGVMPYYFPTKSASRYVGSLPMQRHMPDWNMSKLPEYWENLNQSLNYTGKYVIVEPYSFNLTVYTHSKIANKLNTEYTKVYSNGWDIYQRNMTGVAH